MALSRRGFLTGTAAAAGALAGGVGVAVAREAEGGSSAGSHRYLPFEGAHQTGITAEGAPSSMLAAFDVVASDREELAEALRRLSDESRRLMEGTPYEERDPAYPPLYTGTVGNPPAPADLSVVVSVGASLFDDRFGLADRKPRELVTMPFLANDRLDPARSHGDLLIGVSSADPEHSLFAIRQLMRATRGELVLQWMLDGYTRRSHSAGPGEAGVRNLMGFIDGTANLGTDDATLRRFVFAREGDDEPAWAVGGSYQAVRIIRIFVEFWDRTRLVEQEALIGRRKANGAPLDGERETDIPDYAADPEGELTPLDAHIRLANPRDAATADDLILRRGFSFSRGFDGSGQLDQGLAFVSYQRRLEQFLNTQARLAGEPLEEYILPVGGGFFFALPGVTGADDWLGRSLLDA